MQEMLAKVEFRGVPKYITIPQTEEMFDFDRFQKESKFFFFM